MVPARPRGDGGGAHRRRLAGRPTLGRHDHLGLDGGQILYVGDHFFGDVHASKKILRWRTALIALELEEELEAAAGFAASQAQLEALMQEKEELEHRALHRRLRLLPARS